MLVDLTAGVIGAWFLGLFYRVVKDEWPDNYASMSDLWGRFSRRNLLLYLLFRGFPIFVSCVFVASIRDAAGGRAAVAVMTLVAVHVGRTNGRALWGAWRRRGSGEILSNLVAYYVASTVILFISAGAAFATFERFRQLIPSGDDLVNALWTGLFAAVLGLGAQQLRFEQLAAYQQVRRARQELGEALWQDCARAAAQYSTDPALIRAIVSCEVLQRPAWVRRLEQIKGVLLPAGTYGVAQMRSDRPIDDRESIYRLAEAFAGYYPEIDPDTNTLREHSFRAMVERHNRRRVFVDLVASFYAYLEASLDRRSELAVDGRGVLEIFEYVRVGEAWEFTGSAVLPAQSLVCVVELAGSRQKQVVLPQGASARQGWTARAPVQARSVRFLSLRSSGGPRQRTLALIDIPPRHAVDASDLSRPSEA